ncbi:hypothetical protein IIA79_03975 [bacterium]|nr:hypothetical protein [bacterium]
MTDTTTIIRGAEVFDGEKMIGVRDVTVEDSVLHCTVIGKPDALIKAAAQFEVVKLVSHEPNLEDIFLSYYNEGGEHAA